MSRGVAHSPVGVHLPGAGAVHVHARAAMSVRPGTADDLETIHAVLNTWSEVGLTLPRSRADIARHIASFSVVHSDDRLAACAALHRYETFGGPLVAEIRSVASAPEARGTGAATLVVEDCVARAAMAGLDRIHLLSRTPGFFERRGFRVVRFRDVPADFLEHAIRRQGRTIAGRTCMVRATAPPQPSVPQCST